MQASTAALMSADDFSRSRVEICSAALNFEMHATGALASSEFVT